MPKFVQQREMTISHADFFRLLPRALENHAYQHEGNQVFAALGNASLTISLSEEGVRNMGVMSLPVTKIQIEIEGLGEMDREKFLKRFDLAYQKGGG